MDRSDLHHRQPDFLPRHADLDRRRFLVAGAAGIGAALLAHRSESRAAAGESLKDIARRSNIGYGAMASYGELFNDPAFATAIERECGILVNGWDFSLPITRPGRGEYDFRRPDFVAAFAEARGMALRCHTLVYHRHVPDWVRDASGRGEAEKLLVGHVEALATRYRGRVAAWDVVNEVIERSATSFELHRKSPWLELIGPEYIDIAFAAAAAADPCAMLVFNENGFHHVGLRPRLMRWKTLKRLEALKKANAPVHALGIQGHIHATIEIDDDGFREFLKEVADLGLAILITELDVLDTELDYGFDERDRRVADCYARFLAAVVEQPAVVAVTTWGLSDRYTWYNTSHPFAVQHRRKDGADQRPLVLDNELNRKPAWRAVADAFARATPRRTPWPGINACASDPSSPIGLD